MKKKIIFIILSFLLFPIMANANQVSFLIIDADSYLVNKAFNQLDLPENIKVNFYTYGDIQNNSEVREFIEQSNIIIVDVMMNELSLYLIENIDISKKKVYAIRGSRDDDDLKKKGFVFDPTIAEYFSHLSVFNITNMIKYVINRDIDKSVSYKPVKKNYKLGIYHTEAKDIFTKYEDYLNWYKKRENYNAKNPWLGIMMFASSLIEGQVDKINYLVKRFEQAGFNVLPCFGRDFDMITSFLMDDNRKARVDLVASLSLKFYSAINDQLKQAVLDLDVPIFNIINLYTGTIDTWKADPVGIPLMDVTWKIANPEITGLIEPTPVAGKVQFFDEKTGKAFFKSEPIKENIELLIPRLKMWVNLKKKKNDQKKVMILYYNHSQGKQNVGASYLNVFRSLENILDEMGKQGYVFQKGQNIDEQNIKNMVLSYGRNVGSWAPGELDKMIEQEKIVRLDVQTYAKWFERLPTEFKDNVIKQWGKVEDSNIMIKDGKFIIPAVILGNIAIMPEPSRGWSDEPMKLYHDPTLYPHHQYIAAYLWIKYVFDADAMIHLGTHATHEWLPGKQAGLSPSCPPEVLVTDIPNLYPYIVDDVGEGIQAKRRGRGVIIDHLTPPLVKNQLFYEYSALYELIGNYNQAVSMNSSTAEIKFREIAEMAQKIGIAKDLEITDFTQQDIERLEHYILELKETLLPFGLHTFGKSPQTEAIESTANCILKDNKELSYEAVKQALSISGDREIKRLMKGLCGGFIPAGEGNDPIRNPGAIPTGKNFFGFNPEKIPSKAAWELGKKAAQQIIEKSIKQGKGYPQKAGVVLWATETIRNEGVNESTLFYLIGVKPVWDHSDRVTGIEVIPGKILNRPRIDVLVNPSGLYRDLFPNMILMIDKAVQKASVQTDIENLIANHNRQIKTRLINSGMDEEQAEIFSKIRIFTETPGSYGNGVSEMVGASGVWESEKEIVSVYENRSGHAFGMGKWGEKAKDLFKENLKEVDIAVHSISSNVYGTMDNDDLFQYLGGLSMAVRHESGKAPETLITMQQKRDKVEVEDLSKTIGRELRSRYLNPKWIEGMKKEDYAGAREISKFVEYMWGWQVTTPFAIDKTKWEQTYEVYVEDKYGLDINEFMNKANPWAYQSITARMLEAVRKKYWDADQKVTQKLAVEYATNVVEKGVACCDHTCNNPLLNQMVVNIISLPGVMSPEIVEKFKLAIEKAAAKQLDQQVKERLDLQKQLTADMSKDSDQKNEKQENKTSQRQESAQNKEEVEGYKMEKMESKDETSEVGSSGIQWLASVFVLVLIAFFVYGIKKRSYHVIIVFFITMSFACLSFAGEKQRITLLIGVSTSHKVSTAISEVLEIPEVASKYDFIFYTDEDLKDNKLDKTIINNSKIIIADDMHSVFVDYVLKNVDYKKIKVYGLCSSAKETDKIINDPKIKQYHFPNTKENTKNLLLFLLNRDLGFNINYGEPQDIPKSGIFHPKANKIYTDFNQYLAWYKQEGLYKQDGFWVGIPDLSTYAFPGETGEIVGGLIERLEENRVNVIPVYSYPAYVAMEQFFFDENGKSRVNLVTAFSFKFAGVNNQKTREILTKLDVPLLDAVKIYINTIEEWRNSEQGLGAIEISYALSTPEFNGLIEPSVLGGRVAIQDKLTGKEVFVHKPIDENIDFFINRIKAWRNLQTKPNKDKKVVIVYWNHTPGKQNVGATYLNVFRSLGQIVKNMRDQGYHIDGDLPSEQDIKELVLKTGRNIGSWAPGELDELINTNKVIRLPIAKYNEWYNKIDESYKNKLNAEWGSAKDSEIMTKNNEIIIPYVNLGNIILVPQPSRGWSDDPQKLYHSTQLWPHHQYTAFYLWLKNEFKADAMISLGTHGTHEWLPGKQSGLSQSCPPEVLIQDIPNIYPYIMDDVGEGIQAKRRGRGVILDYLIPAMKKAGAYEEYRDLAVLINEYNDALTRSVELANQKFKTIKTQVQELGLDKDLLLDQVTQESVATIEHYLIELQESNVPYGMHTFGISPKDDALEDFSQLMKERNEDLSLDDIKKGLTSCYLEIDHLIAALEGRYIPPGEGNDPLRNADALPTGKNFYGFDPTKVPSKEAYEIGKKQAEQMIEKYLKEKGEYPEKIGLILWSIELQRNEGTQVATILYLLGMKPSWDKNNKVKGVEPIPGAILGRPRIDVHIQSSGLFRDNYPNVILLLDEAVRQASHLKDVENFIDKHSQQIKTYLLKNGYDEKQAESLSKVRVFSARPGSYGTTIEDLIPNSGLWEKDEEIADVYMNFVSFGYSKDVWGKPLNDVYKKNLENVKVTMHTRSSNLFMNMDTDDVFACLGGLSLAVKKVSGQYPDVLLSIQKDPDAAHIADIEKILGQELRSRYLNPKWIEGMKKEDYAGAREMSRFVEHMWGWQVTTPFAIDDTKWKQTYEVYVEDKYGLDINEFINKANPWAYQSITARMLEAVRKKYWDAEEKVTQKLAVEYATNVVEKGVACCDHTCNNPLLNQMVVNIISLPGVMSPEIVEKFKLAIEKAANKKLDQQVKDRVELQKQLTADTSKEAAQKDANKAAKEDLENKKDVEGYKMEKMDSQDETSEVGSSGIQWLASIFVLILIAFFVYGIRRRS